MRYRRPRRKWRRASSSTTQPPGGAPTLPNAELLQELYQVTESVFQKYLSKGDYEEYEFHWRLSAEPAEPSITLPERDDAMQFSVAFDPYSEVLNIEAVYRKTCPRPERPPDSVLSRLSDILRESGIGMPPAAHEALPSSDEIVEEEEEDN